MHYLVILSQGRLLASMESQVDHRVFILRNKIKLLKESHYYISFKVSYVFCMYLLSTVGLTPGGSSRVQIYTHKEYIERHKTDKL